MEKNKRSINSFLTLFFKHKDYSDRHQKVILKNSLNYMGYFDNVFFYIIFFTTLVLLLSEENSLIPLPYHLNFNVLVCHFAM